MSATTRWHPFRAGEELTLAAARWISDASMRAIRDRGRFSIVLSGGNTPRATYRSLRDIDTDWTAWHVYFGDERCLHAAHADRNSRMAAETWLGHVAIPHRQGHVIPAELGPEAAARAYGRTLAGAGEFDLVFLGIGEDGHTASLFPGRELGRMQDSPDVLPVFDAPKPPPERVTLSVARLSRARQVLFLIEGQGKRQAVADWRAGKEIPASAVMAPSGVDVLLDEALLESNPG